MVNLLGMSIEDRPAFFEGLLPRLQELRVQTGRPHWIVVDEVHHLLPSTWAPASQTLPQELRGFLFITVWPEHVAPAALSMVDALIGIGESPDQTIRRFHETLGHKPAPSQPVTLEPDKALVWLRQKDADLVNEVARIEGLPDISDDESRSRIRAAIEERYTLPS